jgi:hypothetical protein
MISIVLNIVPSYRKLKICNFSVFIKNWKIKFLFKAQLFYLFTCLISCLLEYQIASA